MNALPGERRPEVRGLDAEHEGDSSAQVIPGDDEPTLNRRQGLHGRAGEPSDLLKGPPALLADLLDLCATSSGPFAPRAACLAKCRWIKQGGHARDLIMPNVLMSTMKLQCHVRNEVTASTVRDRAQADLSRRE